MLYIRSPTHSACMQARHAFEPRPHLFVDHTAIIMIWRAQNVGSSTTPDQWRIQGWAKIFGGASRRYTQASARSRALATAWSRAYCAITLMASNTIADNGS